MSEVVSGIRIGIQGSGQLVGELPPPTLFAEHLVSNPAVPTSRLLEQVERLARAVLAVAR